MCLFVGKREKEILETEKKKQNFLWYVPKDNYSYFLYVVEGFPIDTRSPFSINTGTLH